MHLDVTRLSPCCDRVSHSLFNKLVASLKLNSKCSAPGHAQHLNVDMSVRTLQRSRANGSPAAPQVDKETYFLTLHRLAAGPLAHVMGPVIGEAERLGLLPDRIDHLGEMWKIFRYFIGAFKSRE